MKHVHEDSASENNKKGESPTWMISSRVLDYRSTAQESELNLDNRGLTEIEIGDGDYRIISVRSNPIISLKNIGKFKSIVELRVDNCSMLESFSQVPFLPKLKKFSCTNTPLVKIPHYKYMCCFLFPKVVLINGDKIRSKVKVCTSKYRDNAISFIESGFVISSTNPLCFSLQ